MTRMIYAKGFALPAAIFVVVVLGATVISMARLNAAQSVSSALGAQASRAYWTARSGLEWGINQIDAGGVGAGCFSTTTLSDFKEGLSGFSVQVSCTRQSYKEGSSTDNVYVYDLIAEANYGATPSNPDYVYRKVQVTLAVK